MKAKFIYEAFTQDSDPVHDLGIGIDSILKHKVEPDIIATLQRLNLITFDISLINENPPINRHDYVNTKIENHKLYISGIKEDYLDHRDNVNFAFDIIADYNEKIEMKWEAIYDYDSHPFAKGVIQAESFDEFIPRLFKLYDEILKKYDSIDFEEDDYRIFEKFTQNSDPIEDLHIGGIDFYKISREYLKKYGQHDYPLYFRAFLKSFIGKTISGIFRNYKGVKTFKIRNIDFYDYGNGPRISTRHFGYEFVFKYGEKYIITDQNLPESPGKGGGVPPGR